MLNALGLEKLNLLDHCFRLAVNHFSDGDAAHPHHHARDPLELQLLVQRFVLLHVDLHEGHWGVTVLEGGCGGLEMRLQALAMPAKVGVELGNHKPAGVCRLRQKRIDVPTEPTDVLHSQHGPRRQPGPGPAPASRQRQHQRQRPRPRPPLPHRAPCPREPCPPGERATPCPPGPCRASEL